MGGHLMPVVDKNNNDVYLSLHTSLPDHLQLKLKDLNMNTFSYDTFVMGCEVVSYLKNLGFQTKICVLVNNVTDILTLVRSDANSNVKKSMQEFQLELLADFFTDQKMPKEYLKILSDFGLTLEDVIQDTYTIQKIKGEKDLIIHPYCFQEKVLQQRFMALVKANKEKYGKYVKYKEQKVNLGWLEAESNSVEESEETIYDISLPYFSDSDPKYCGLEGVIEKVGGNRCSVEMTSLALHLFGGDLEGCKNVPQTLKPDKTYSKNVLISLVPFICEKAVVRGNTLYDGLFSPKDREVSVLQIPVPPNTELLYDWDISL